MVSVQLGATIPVAQYANLQPVVTMEGETTEAALNAALGEIKKLWDRTAPKPLEIAETKTDSPEGVVKLCRVSGTKVIFDPIAHTYRDSKGNYYRGGSGFASKYKEKFPAELIAKKMADKAGGEVSPEQIIAMWDLNGEASSSHGTGVHAALQLYGEYAELSRKVKGGSDEAALTKNPTLRPMVLDFFTDARKAETAYYEEFVCDERILACGLIDRLVVEDDGLWVEDYKTNADVHKPEKILAPFTDVVEPTALGGYVIQLSYYGTILQRHGRTVKGLRIHHWAGSKWVTYEREMIDLSGVLGGDV